MTEHSSFFSKNSFIIKFHKEKIERLVFPKMLFFSFCLKRKKILQKIRTFLQIQGRKNCLYIEDLSKEINRDIFEKFRFSNISIEINQFKKKCGKIFHEKAPFPVLKFNEKIFLKKNKNEKIFGFIKGYDSDFVKVWFLEKTRNFHNKKGPSYREECFNFSGNPEGNLKKIKINRLFLLGDRFQRNLGKTQLTDLETPGLRYSGLENFLKIRDIVQLKDEPFAKIITELSDKEVKLLSLDGYTQTVTWKKLQKRFLKKKIISSEGYDNNGKMILEGDYCKVFPRSNKEDFCKILFIQDGFLFLNRLNVSSECIDNLLTASCSKIELVTKKNFQYENFFETLPSNVKISKGILKGYEGNITQIEKENVEINVLSIGKTVKIPIQNIKWEKNN